MKKVDTLLFDLDGTLIDTNAIIIESFKHTFNKYVPDFKFDIELFKTFIGPTLEETFTKHANKEFVSDMINEYRKFYKENEYDYFKIYPNVLEVISKLKEEGYNLAIVTTKFKESAWPSFTHFGLNKYFDVFIALDHVEKPKPNREPIDKALAKFEHSGAIMIGDNQGDLLAGKNAGIFSCGVAWSFKGMKHLLKVNPDFMIEDMKDLFTILDKLNA